MQFKVGTFLIPTVSPVVPGGETPVEFMQVLGGDAETFLVIAMITNDGLIRGVPLGKNHPVIPPFVPGWDADQLQQEIAAGAWTHITHDHPQFVEYDAEGRRRSELMMKHLDSSALDTCPDCDH